MIEYEPIKIRHAVVQCPCCENWFKIEDCVDDLNWNGYELFYKVFSCPKCGKIFSNDIFDLNIREEYHQNFPKTLKMKISWE